MTRFALALAPASEPVTLEEAKTHARVRHARDDVFITSLIAVARRRAEHDTGKALISQRWTATLDAWPEVESGEAFRRVALAPHNPSSIVSLVVDGTTIAATDDDGNAVYALRGDELWVSSDVVDPDDDSGLGGGIVATFTAAIVDAQDLAVFKLAIQMNVAYWYENREAVRTDGGYPAVVAMGYDALISPYKVLEL